MDLRPQAHEIIRTWAFYTIVKAWMHEGQVPWHNVAISGWILDPDRKKMSKSKGNVVTPVQLLEQYSVDAVRYWAARARLGTDTTYDEKVFQVGRKLATKIFNASRFVVQQLQRVGAAAGEGGASAPAGALSVERITHPLDRAVVAYLQQAIRQATEAFGRFEYAVALQRSEEAFWAFCDHYVELAKVRSYAEQDTPGRASALATLHHGLGVLLRLLAPFVPYVTEECWSWWMQGEGRLRSIHTAPWPTVDELAGAEAVKASADSFPAAVEVTGAIRAAKSRAQKSLKWPVAALRITAAADRLDALRPVLDDVLRAGAVPESAVELVDGVAPDGAAYATEVTLAEQA
jgi:valyl-tRNA synthetase